MKNRDDRSVQFFGAKGQQKIRQTTIMIGGIGGLGTHVVQQVALLGVRKIILVDDEVLGVTNLNRYVGVGPEDVGKWKVDLGERHIKSIRPEIEVVKIYKNLISDEAFKVLKTVDYIFGCVDNEGARLTLTDLTSRTKIPFFDLASDIITDGELEYGGRVFFNGYGDGCLYCSGLIDLKEAQEDLMDENARRDREHIYGVKRELLDRSGPSVVSINGVIASLAITEFMVQVSGIRVAKKLVEYFGSRGVVFTRTDEPSFDCYYCHGIRGKVDEAAEQFILRGASARNTPS